MPPVHFVAAPPRARQGVIKIDSIFTSTLQPRTVFDDSSLEELTASVRSRGIIEPLIVRPRDNGWELVCGERRYRAALAVGLCEVPVRVLDLDDDDAYLMALHENVHRDSLSPIDEARAYRRILESGRVRSQRALSRVLNLSQSRISQRLALLTMPHEVLAAMSGPGHDRPRLTERHAREIRKLRGNDSQAALAHRVVAESLTVEETRALVRASRTERPSMHPAPDNRLKSLLHYWLAIWEHPEGDTRGLEDLLDPAGFSIDLPGAPPATTLDALAAACKQGAVRFPQRSHTAEDVRITGTAPEYRLRMRVAWRGVSATGEVASAHTVHEWTIQDYGERFPRIRRVLVTLG